MTEDDFLTGGVYVGQIRSFIVEAYSHNKIINYVV